VIIINGGTVSVGSDGTSFGVLRFWTGGQSNYTGLWWVQGRFLFNWHVADPFGYNQDYLSSANANSMAVIGYQPGPPPNPPSYGFVGVGPVGGRFNVFYDIYTVTVYQNPTASVAGWTDSYDATGWWINNNSFSPRRR
jgi:hypothetical protein